MPKRTLSESLRSSRKFPLHQHNRVSEVTIGGTTFKSDRFYLNSGPDNNTTKPTCNSHSTNDNVHPGNTCQCGAATCSPPPLFDRDKLLREKIDNNELKAVIIGTFNVCFEWLPQRYPELMGPDATIPTLLLYGRKATMDYSNGEPGTSSSLIEQEDTNTNDSWATQSSHNNGQEEVSPTSWFGKNFHITKVLPTRDGSIKGVTQEKKDTKRDRKWTAGVHHPKFLLLFEKSGHLTVVVSTANFVPSATLEGSWIQRFPPRHGKVNSNFSPSNDFGKSLQDFLVHLGKASEEGGMRVGKFMKDYMGIKLGEFFWRYRFEKANVHLIPTIPGQFRTGDGSAHQYGRHRVQKILKELAQKQKQKQEQVPTTTKDQLIMQPTSIGKDMTIGPLAHIAKSYMNCSRKEHTTDVFDIIDRTTIIWPSWEFLASFTDKITTDKPPRKRDSTGKSKDVIFEKGTAEDFDCYVFLSADGFNSLSTQCIYRLAQFQTSHPCQFPSRLLTPHFKSIARICSDSNVCNEEGRKETISWFLLTSACLSHGAQGKKMEKEGQPDECISYANFELGVLFTSERPEAASGRLYCFGPKDCTFSGSSRFNLIHLPIPYSLEPKFYMNENEKKMSAMPYFHEIKSKDTIGGNFFEYTPWKQCKYFNRAKGSENKENYSKAKRAKLPR